MGTSSRKKSKLLLEEYVKLVLKSLLAEDFNWDQFSAPADPHDDASAIFKAIQAMGADPEGRKVLATQKQREAQSFVDVLQANKQQLAKKGINVDSLKRLGEGSGGVAYDIGDNKVLKVTGDAKEARVGNNLKGKNIKGIANIYDVWKFQNSNLYGLVLEKITTFDKWPNDSLKKNIEEIVDGFNLKEMMEKYQNNWNKIWAEISSSPLFKMAGDPKELKTAFEIISNIEINLQKAGVENFSDLHTGNLGKRPNGEVLVFDIGFVHGGSEPPILGTN